MINKTALIEWILMLRERERRASGDRPFPRPSLRGGEGTGREEKKRNNNKTGNS